MQAQGRESLRVGHSHRYGPLHLGLPEYWASSSRIQLSRGRVTVLSQDSSHTYQAGCLFVLLGTPIPPFYISTQPIAMPLLARLYLALPLLRSLTTVVTTVVPMGLRNTEESFLSEVTQRACWSPGSAGNGERITTSALLVGINVLCV